jgi:hypothetical protein
MADETIPENRVLALAREFAGIVGRGTTDVMLRLLETESLAKAGYDGTGHLTEAQAEVAARVLNGWIERSK